MIDLITTTNHILAWFGLFGLVASLYVVVDFYTAQRLKAIIYRYGLWAALFVSTGASAMALVYSDVFGLVPCGLCWFLRVFLFSQVVVYAVAIYYKDFNAARYGIALSSFGLIISLYQHYLQMGGSAVIGCPVAGAGADCAKRFLFEFGFITFPLLAGIGFFILIVLGYYLLNSSSTSRKPE